ncbi:MAG: sulfatase-like hydrolase/transferase, partial [Candidatus Hydrogenedentes bacterium]|nr:sulfatase-like hydrolase/transferase [Candidatus Hydrogenedentota bacterium]
MNGLGVSRRTFLAGSAAAVMGGCATLGRGIGAGARPNIIYAFSDEHRYQSMSFTDMPLLHTPTMERLAREGCSFSHCISNYPVCSPH